MGGRKSLGKMRTIHTFVSAKGVVVRNHRRRILVFQEKTNTIPGLQPPFFEVPHLAAVHWKRVIESVEKILVVGNC